MLWRIVKLALGLAVGVALWLLCSDAWNHALAAMTQPLMRLDPRLADGSLVAVGRTIVVQPLRETLPTATLFASEMTFNVILLVGLFASNRAPFSDRNVKAFLIAFAIVLLLQPLGLFVSIESTYANQQGRWSEQHYGNTASWIWLDAEMFYRLIGMFGIVFAAWWISAGQTSASEPRRR